jgi:hypothetical protein
MTVRTLAEAAAEVLSKSKTTAAHEPMHKGLDKYSSMPAAHVVDLGGATHENPEGTHVGKVTADHRGTATPPGVKPAADTKQAMKHLNPQAQNTEAHPALADPEHLNGPHVDTAGHDYAHPTINEKKHHEEEEEEEEEEEAKLHEKHHMHHHMHTEHSKRYHAHMEAHRHHMEEGNMEEAKHHMEEAHRCATEHFAETGYPVHDKEHKGTHPHVSNDMEECYGSMEESVEMTEEEIAEARKMKLEMMKEKMKHMKGMKEDIEALFNGEDLSEDFKLKATTIFETAVIARAVSVVEELETEILAAAEESIEEVKAELEEQVDAYLNYMVEEWVNENAVAIESGLKSEIVEDFMTGLKGLFAEHYIEVPEEKVDVLEAMAEENAELEAKLNEALNKNIQLAQAIVEARKSELINSVCEGLTATQAEKVKTLAEGVEFTTEGEYNKKIAIIRESYVASESKVKGAAKQIKLTEEAEPVTVAAEINPVMDKYVRAISRTNPV